MNKRIFTLLPVAIAAVLLAPVGAGAAAPAAPQNHIKLYLPLVLTQYACPTIASSSFSGGNAVQWDTDDPVRPAWNHADKNLALRGYSLVDAPKTFWNWGPGDGTQPPQLATLFDPDRVPVFSNVYNANDWFWQGSPDPGFRGGPLNEQWPVTVIGFQTTAGEVLQVPTSEFQIAAGYQAMILYADANNITFKYAVEDSVQPHGYTVHVDNICTDSNLLALYNSLDNMARATYWGTPNQDLNPDYILPYLAVGQSFGTARDTEIRVVIRDTGGFMDPRSCNEWWQIRPAPAPPC